MAEGPAAAPAAPGARGADLLPLVLPDPDLAEGQSPVLSPLLESAAAAPLGQLRPGLGSDQSLRLQHGRGYRVERDRHGGPGFLLCLRLRAPPLPGSRAALLFNHRFDDG